MEWRQVALEWVEELTFLYFDVALNVMYLFCHL